MASGMEMLFKSLGIDPTQIIAAIEGMGKGVVEVKERLGRIEATQQNILRILENGCTTEREAIKPAAGDDAERTIPGK